MASEIALAELAGRDSALLNVGRRMIRTSSRSSRQLAELAGVLASRELREGSLKEARSHLRLALEQPTDNVVAQAMMEARQMGVRLDEPAIVQAVSRSAEAQLLQAWMAAARTVSEAHALRWHAEEPFSSRPLQFLTSLYALQGEYRKALEWVQKGLIADPDDLGLISNLSIAQAAVGDEVAAEASIKRARSLRTAGLEPFFKATEGLIALRRKKFDVARTLYREAEQTLLNDGRESVAALCVAHYAKFAVEYGAADADALRQEAQQKVEKAPTIDGLIMLGKL